MKTVALLDNARIPIIIDIGLGDALTKPDCAIDYPSLLGDPRNCRILRLGLWAAMLGS